MKRNINLYQTDTGTRGGALTARRMLTGWLLLLAVLAVSQQAIDHRRATAARAADAMKLEVAAAQDQLDARMAASMAGTDPQIEARLKNLMRELDLRQTILGLLDGGNAGDTAGFSAQLRSLAKQHAEGVWLTRVEVQAPGARTALEGEALSPEFVPLYLRQLSAEPALAGQRFDRFQIGRVTESGDTVQFALNRAVDMPDRDARK